MRHFLIALLVLFNATMSHSSGPCKPWSATLFLAEGSTHGIEKIIQNGNLYLKKTFFVSAEVMRQLYCWDQIFFLNNVILEAEAQIAKHWGKQQNSELTFAPLFRLNTITWPEVMCMNFAIGDGISQSLGKPKCEHVQVKTLNYLLVEGVFFLSEQPDWQMALRWHHRCKCFGLFSNRHGSGSNFIALGLRYRFG